MRIIRIRYRRAVKNWNDSIAAQNAAPWTLSEVKLPSGARLKVSYESDDYAYVQNKRAMQFFSIAGFWQLAQQYATTFALSK